MLSACGAENSGKTQIKSQAGEYSVSAQRSAGFAQVSTGRKVFQKKCSGCHGEKAQGADNWRKIGVDGRWPPPPLNGSGHAWHHPQQVLHNVIKNGSPNGQGNMPAWGETLTDQEIDAVILWFQSLWPKKIYESWAKGMHKHQG